MNEVCKAYQQDYLSMPIPVVALAITVVRAHLITSLLMRRDVPVIRSNGASMRGLMAPSMNRNGTQKTNIKITVSPSIHMKVH